MAMSSEIVLLRQVKPDCYDVTAADPTRSRVPTILRWIALIGLFAFTLEMTCRIEDWLRFRTSLLSPITSQDDLFVHDETGIHGRPNVRFRKWVMNGLGTRGP